MLGVINGEGWGGFQTRWQGRPSLMKDLEETKHLAMLIAQGRSFR